MIGREVTVNELKPDTVYALVGERHPNVALTMWYRLRLEDWAVFHATRTGMALALKPNRSGELFDGTEQRVHVYSYLEEPEDRNVN